MQVGSLEEKLDSVDLIFPIFRRDGRISEESISKYYDSSNLGYRFFHSQAGSIHMALSKGEIFHKKDYSGQPRIISSFITNDTKKVLEVGCGQGFNLEFLAHNHPNVEFYGVDLSAENLRCANKKKSENVTLRQGSYNQMSDQEPSELDIIYGVETLCHSTDIQRTLKELAGKLKKGGCLLVFDGFRSQEFFSNQNEQRAVEYIEQAMRVPLFRTKKQFIDCAKKNNLHCVQDRDMSKQILPNLKRLERLAMIFFSNRFFAKILKAVLPYDLIENSIAGLLMHHSVSMRLHTYNFFVLTKGESKQKTT